MTSLSSTIRRALISVSDKSGVASFAAGLSALGAQIISTGGTARLLRDNGIAVTDVSEITGFPGILEGRVKTLHPSVHGGLLALRDSASHLEQLRRHGIEPIDLVAVNLYPFSVTISRPGATVDDAIENIDIGGPSMIRSAAKNFRDVAVVTDSADYAEVLAELREQGSLSLATRLCLARRAFLHTAEYDRIIGCYFTDCVEVAESRADLRTRVRERFPARLDLSLDKACDLRYGENPHQRAALYVSSGNGEGIAQAGKLQGKDLSFNNFLDADAAWSLASEFTDPACVIVKHTNPCGAAAGFEGADGPAELYQRARACDPLSAFGGIIAFNVGVDERAAAEIAKTFYEVIVAPQFSSGALEIFAPRKNLRLLRAKVFNGPDGWLDFKRISGGFLVQERDHALLSDSLLKTVTARPATDSEMRALRLAWTICKHVKSNAIVYATERELVGVGAGQMSRVDSVRFGAMKAVLPLEGTVVASDAFFPFRDGIDEAAKHGVTAVIQPGGSIRDAEVISAANEHGLAMVFTGVRHFRH